MTGGRIDPTSSYSFLAHFVYVYACHILVEVAYISELFGRVLLFHVNDFLNVRIISD